MRLLHSVRLPAIQNTPRVPTQFTHCSPRTAPAPVGCAEPPAARAAPFPGRSAPGSEANEGWMGNQCTRGGRLISHDCTGCTSSRLGVASTWERGGGQGMAGGKRCTGAETPTEQAGSLHACRARGRRHQVWSSIVHSNMCCMWRPHPHSTAHPSCPAWQSPPHLVFVELRFDVRNDCVPLDGWEALRRLQDAAVQQQHLGGVGPSAHAAATWGCSCRCAATAAVATAAAQ